jgi:DNA-damage-inducible protein J
MEEYMCLHKLEIPNEITATAIADGKGIMSDSSVKGYTDMEDLKKALDIEKNDN